MRKKSRERLGKLAAAGAILLIAGAVFMVIKSLLAHSGKPVKPSVAQIQLLKPPPPPPPPKPEEKPPEPEIKKEEVKIDQPKPDQPEAKNDEPPPGDKLGVDADGTAGGDSFGLVGNKGGSSLVGSGGGSKYGYYTSKVQQQIQERLAQDKKLRSASYRVTVRLWLGQDGSIQRFDLVGSTGNEETDQALKAALAEIHRMPEAPPADMPQPVGLRVVSRA